MPYNTLPKHLQDEIVRLYCEGKLINEIEVTLGLSYRTVAKYIRAAGLTIRRSNKHNQRYTLDATFFDTIDTESKAYWLGFLYADGNVHIAKSSNTHVLNLNLQERDRNMVDAFREAIRYTGPVFAKRYRNPNYQTAYGVNVCSKELCQALIRLGCVPAKSLVLQFPTEEQVPHSLVRHFVRGYFDGDGSVGGYVRKERPDGPKRYIASIVSSPMFVAGLRSYLAAQGIETTLDASKRAHSARIGSIQALRELSVLLYEGSTVCLERKRVKFTAFHLQHPV